jgi:DNA/RNA-binding domain of Phe-tRNA-synthetase-like protein
VTLKKAGEGEGYEGIGKSFLDMENMLVLADDDGVFGSSMSDSTRAMVTEKTKDVLVVVYCFEDDIDLEQVLSEGAEAFAKYAGAEDVETWIV